MVWRSFALLPAKYDLWHHWSVKLLQLPNPCCIAPALKQVSTILLCALDLHYTIECENKSLERSLRPDKTIFIRLIGDFSTFIFWKNICFGSYINLCTYQGLDRRGAFYASAWHFNISFALKTYPDIF